MPGIFLRTETQAFKLVHPVSAFNWGFERRAPEKSRCSGLHGCFAHPLQGIEGIAASQSGARRRTLSRHEGGDGFEHDALCQMGQGRCNMGCLLLPWDDNFWRRTGSGRGSGPLGWHWCGLLLEDVVPPLPPSGDIPRRCLVLQSRSSKPSRGCQGSHFHLPLGETLVWLCMQPPRHWGKRARLWQPAATAAFGRTFSWQDSQCPWGQGQITWLPAMSHL